MGARPVSNRLFAHRIADFCNKGGFETDAVYLDAGASRLDDGWKEGAL
jgi:hypothetical protein